MSSIDIDRARDSEDLTALLCAIGIPLFMVLSIAIAVALPSLGRPAEAPSYEDSRWTPIQSINLVELDKGVYLRGATEKSGLFSTYHDYRYATVVSNGSTQTYGVSKLDPLNYMTPEEHVSVYQDAEVGTDHGPRIIVSRCDGTFKETGSSDHRSSCRTKDGKQLGYWDHLVEVHVPAGSVIDVKEEK